MFEFMRSAVQFIAPVFVICTMLNAGLTQRPSDIAGHLKSWPFLLKMLLANFVLAPLLMVVALHFAPFDPALKAGLLVFSLGAGAPFLIKLTQTAEHEVALGAAVMMVVHRKPVRSCRIEVGRLKTSLTSNQSWQRNPHPFIRSAARPAGPPSPPAAPARSRPAAPRRSVTAQSR